MHSPCRCDVLHETFLGSHQHVHTFPLCHGSSVPFRYDHRGGCNGSMMPQLTNIQYHPSLEVASILVNCQQLCVVDDHSFLLTHFSHCCDYLRQLPHSTIPTMIVGDFNENLLSPPISKLLTVMSLMGW